MATSADKLKLEIDTFRKLWLNELPWIEAHTSGSTGMPKPIRLSKADMLLSARATNRIFGINAESVLGLALSTDYIAGKMICVRAWAAGCRILPLGVERKLHIPEHLSLLAVVPNQVPSLLAMDNLPQTIDTLLIGGAPLPPDIEQELVKQGINAYVSYGMTETCSHVALRRVGSEYYTAIDGIQFEVDHDNALRIIAPNFSFKSLQTNDIAELLSPHEFIWKGRRDNIINSGGIKIQAEALEQALAQTLGNANFCIVGLPDSDWGQAVTLVVEAHAISQERINQAIASIADSRLRPKRIEIIDRIPHTASGKIARAQLLEILQSPSATHIDE